MVPGHMVPGHMVPGHMVPEHMVPGHMVPGHMDLVVIFRVVFLKQLFYFIFPLIKINQIFITQFAFA